ncbi:hypothetical protein BC629DRAFT_1014156 [Irpex lacteus]|nr:hypothetical protein BC629DRAFT_1014156 [Irpex lacteus]
MTPDLTFISPFAIGHHFFRSIYPRTYSSSLITDRQRFYCPRNLHFPPFFVFIPSLLVIIVVLFLGFTADGGDGRAFVIVEYGPFKLCAHIYLLVFCTTHTTWIVPYR